MAPLYCRRYLCYYAPRERLGRPNTERKTEQRTILVIYFHQNRLPTQRNSPPQVRIEAAKWPRLTRTYNTYSSCSPHTVVNAWFLSRRCIRFCTVCCGIQQMKSGTHTHFRLLTLGTYWQFSSAPRQEAHHAATGPRRHPRRAASCDPARQPGAEDLGSASPTPVRITRDSASCCGRTEPPRSSVVSSRFRPHEAGEDRDLHRLIAPSAERGRETPSIRRWRSRTFASRNPG